MAHPQVWVVRHGRTEWSAAGRHTGRSDIPLDDDGREQARALRQALQGHDFAQVLTSPLRRAWETCEIAGFAAVAACDDDLQEWDYGDYDGVTTAEIRAARPGWTLWRDGCPHGETAAEVAARADRVLARARAADGDTLLFSHGHMLRVIAARWIGLDATAGALLALDTATTGVLGWEREQAVVTRWNLPPGPARD